MQEEEESFGSMRRLIFAKGADKPAAEKEKNKKEKDEAVARTLRARRADLPIVFMSGYAGLDNGALTELAILGPMVAKPFAQDALARVKGVGFVRLFGARDYSMRIWLDPEKMARLGVTAADVQRVVQEQNVVAPAGRIGVPPAPAGVPMQYSVTVQGRLTDVTQYENIIISAAPNGQIVRLKDISRIELGGADYSITVQENGVPGVFVGIFLQPDANALDTARDVEATMKSLAQRFPPGMVYSVPYSTTPFVTESM
jgi:multidrug efflux pump subunit AcrB